MENQLLVTGASGQLGRQVLDALLPKGKKIIALTRSPQKLADYARRGVDVRAADFDDATSLPAAFRGATRMLLISTDALDRPGHRIAQHRAAVAAAVEAGVRHLVYTSLPNPGPENEITIAPDHLETEKAIEASPLGYTILRDNLYLELTPAAQIVAEGVLRSATGDGKTAFVTRLDCALTAAAALAADFEGRRVLDVTGPAALTEKEVAAILSEISGRPVRYQALSPDDYRAGLLGAGLPPVAVDLYTSFAVARSKGRLATVTTTVRDLTGKEPTSVASAFRALLK